MNETAAPSGQVAFVTGASSGLGRATAIALPPARWRPIGAVWSAEERSAEGRVRSPRDPLPPEIVAAFIAAHATAPPQLVLDEAVVTPLVEQGDP
jgi:NAD(P)-dependent dehydrogenase (short-subunit alcohol dehydrogenase family)